MAEPPERFDVGRVDGGDAQRIPQALGYIANRLGGIEYQLAQQTELLSEIVAAIRSAQARKPPQE